VLRSSRQRCCPYMSRRRWARRAAVSSFLTVETLRGLKAVAQQEGCHVTQGLSLLLLRLEDARATRGTVMHDVGSGSDEPESTSLCSPRCGARPSLTLHGSIMLWHRLLRRSASESGTLCQGDGGAIVSGGHGPQGNPAQFPDSPCIPTSIPNEFPRIAVSGRALGQDEIGAAIQTTSTSKVRHLDFGDCGPPQRV
jgi:hypothetical protein